MIVPGAAEALEAPRDVRPSVRDCRILVADDARTSRDLIAAFLRGAGYHEIAFAENGHEVLQLLEQQRPDLLILDLLMPEMDGFAVCRAIRNERAWADLPILVQTGMDGAENRVEAFAAGATDLVLKPLNRKELLARVAIHLENRLMFKQLQDYHERVSRELAVARAMQQALLPSSETIRRIRETHDIDLAVFVEPSSDLGGDLCGCMRLSEHQVSIYALDFAGHGVSAAINVFRLHALMSELQSITGNPSVFMTAINASLSELLPAGQYATMFYGVIDIRAQTFTYAASGMLGLMLRRTGEDEFTPLDGSGVPIGVLRGVGYANQTIAFPPGSVLLHCSDALIEARQADGTLVGEQGYATMASALGQGLSAQQQLDALLEGLRQRTSFPLDDDLTILCMKLGGDPRD